MTTWLNESIQMQFRVIVRSDRSGYAALGPTARGFRAKRRLGQHDDRRRSQPQRGNQPSQAAADDHRCAADIERCGDHGAMLCAATRRAAASAIGSSAAS